MNTPDVVSPAEWEAAYKQMLVAEKEHHRAADALAAQRRRMPWMEVDKAYRFMGPGGELSFEDLFEGRRQLIVYRAFYGEGVTTTAPGTSRARLPRLLVRRRPGLEPRAPERAGHDPRIRLAGSDRGDPEPEGAARLGAHPLVRDPRRLGRGLRGRRMARAQRLRPP